MKKDQITQPIILRTGSLHEEAVLACAHASFAPTEQRTDGEWDNWLAGNHAKSVRRVSESKFASLQEKHAGHVGEYGEAAAFSLPPMSYEVFPKDISRLQVSGTDFERAQSSPDQLPKNLSSPVILARWDLGMSTGKAGAQVAHAFWLAGEALPVYWVKDSVFFGAEGDVIQDSGLTEFAGPTETMKVLR